MAREDIIPITFMGGTGGHFLCHFIVSAKRNNQDIIKLSEYGNAHWHSLKDFRGPILGVGGKDSIKINQLLEQSKNVDSSIPKPYYTNAHLLDLDLINSNFTKSIRIVYDLDDIDEIATVFYGKFAIDSREHLIRLNLLPEQFKNYTPQKEELKLDITSRCPHFSKKENMPNVLFVSWKELFKENINDLINKLSTFTSINPDNFSPDSLVLWRTKTQYCIDTFTE